MASTFSKAACRARNRSAGVALPYLSARALSGEPEDAVVNDSETVSTESLLSARLACGGRGT
ncbi:hypothetical protein DICSQDRAFT_136121 [Dichomitus squalens LYAD-421 SS1]|uniref:Uncharacterized protein n=1 Tax=Dichomitus squalens (strain LYAD-421) TaxID=732165 RepID=R7T0X5_DICSQ|nr:uncharacterized protein DICSQDRAFT_136121 [Dichomitus squalens LYAD-421 SS1]EJF62006.1 hypothetical protein DICSQDRAFT_136121 [Dichomitus squalens LYAD-421 SS1]